MRRLRPVAVLERFSGRLCYPERWRALQGVALLPAAALLAARQRSAPGVQATPADVAGQRCLEVAARRTGGRRSATDPASRRLCLWCAAVRAVPHPVRAW